MPIRWRPMLIAAAWGWACAASAQIDIAWRLEHTRTVLMEPVRATLRISNYTGADLDLTPNGNARLRFDVEDQPTSTVPETGRPALQKGVIIPDGETREVQADLLPAYRIVRGQTYMVRPVLETGGRVFEGRRLALEVQPGLILLERTTGMPGNGSARDLSLRLIHRGRADHVFFRIDNPDTGFCLGTYDLGQVIRFFEPRLELDAERVFHVLHQTAPDRFVHSRFDYDGMPLGTVFYAGQMGQIRLARDDDGRVAVTGGTAYVEDPGRPGMLTAPALPPSHPYNTTIGELPLKGRPRAPAEPASRRAPVRPAGGSTGEAVTW